MEHICFGLCGCLHHVIVLNYAVVCLARSWSSVLAHFTVWHSGHSSDTITALQLQTVTATLQRVSRVRLSPCNQCSGDNLWLFPPSVALNNLGFNSAQPLDQLAAIDQYFTLWPLWTRRGEGKISICQPTQNIGPSLSLLLHSFPLVVSPPLCPGRGRLDTCQDRVIVRSHPGLYLK